MNQRFWAIFGTVTTVVVIVIAFIAFGRTSNAAPTSASRVVSDVMNEDGKLYAVQHTFLCTLPDGTMARDWHFTDDRWVKNQLSFDEYVVGGRTISAIRQVSSIPAGHVRFRRESVSLAGPSLEGHDYMRTRINGQVATVELDKLFVEHNVRLLWEPQDRQLLPNCGTPRS